MIKGLLPTSLVALALGWAGASCAQGTDPMAGEQPTQTLPGQGTEAPGRDAATPQPARPEQPGDPMQQADPAQPGAQQPGAATSPWGQDEDRDDPMTPGDDADAPGAAPGTPGAPDAGMGGRQ